MFDFPAHAGWGSSLCSQNCVLISCQINRNQVVCTIFRLIWKQMEFRSVYHSDNLKYNLNWIDSSIITSLSLSVHTLKELHFCFIPHLQEYDCIYNFLQGYDRAYSILLTMNQTEFRIIQIIAWKLSKKQSRIPVKLEREQESRSLRAELSWPVGSLSFVACGVGHPLRYAGVMGKSALRHFLWTSKYAGFFIRNRELYNVYIYI